MPILHSRLSKSYRTNNKATSRDVSLCFRNSLVIKKKTICERKFNFMKNKGIELAAKIFLYFCTKHFCTAKLSCIFVQKFSCIFVQQSYLAFV